MRKMLMLVVALVFVPAVFAGGAVAVIKGAAHVWDDVARLTVKKVGKEVSDDAVAAGGKIAGRSASNAFRIGEKQILAGGVSVAAVAGTCRLTAPSAAEADALREQNETAVEIVRKSSPEEQKKFVETISDQIGNGQKEREMTIRYVVVTVASLWGLAGLIFALRKTARTESNPAHVQLSAGRAVCL